MAETSDYPRPEESKNLKVFTNGMSTSGLHHLLLSEKWMLIMLRFL